MDIQKKLQITFAVKNKQNNQSVLIHQVFVLFLHKESNHEVIFIASVDKKKDNLYVINLVSFFYLKLLKLLNIF